jgi:Cu-Zn family superoxide dismutase
MNGKLAVGFLLIGTLNACRPQVETGSPSPAGRATLRNASGATIGVLVLTPSTTGIRITGGLAGLPAGMHGIHLHQVGKCDGSDFSTAGPHMNPSSLHHGLENPLGPHAGDLPNITANSSGVATVDLSTPRVTLDANSVGGLFDADGTAIVVHATMDDQKTDPAGNSGARIACGVIERS